MKSEEDLLLKLLKNSPPSRTETVVPVGDDSFVWQAVSGSGEPLQVLSTDTFTEGVHFKVKYFTPQQVAHRVFEATISDVVAMGGIPKTVFIAIALPDTITEEFLLELYSGLNERARERSVEIGGGETTRTPGPFSITLTAVGAIHSDERFSSHQKLCRRSGAKPGDSLYVTGPLGLSAAGLLALQNDWDGFEALKRAHLTPCARVDLVDVIAPSATSMIDLSDGLSTDLHRLCHLSGCGAVVKNNLLEIMPELERLCSEYEVPVYNCILNGGEDFELLFTAPSCADLPAVKIGTIISEQSILLETKSGQIPLIPGGYDHIVLSRNAVNNVRS